MAKEIEKIRAQRKKIVIGYDFLNEIGGLERVMFFMANALSKDYDVELVFAYVNQKKKEEITKMLELQDKIKITSLNEGKNESVALMKAFLMPGEIKGVEADLIISNSFLFSIMGEKYSEKKGKPYIVLMHHPPNFLYSQVSFKKWANNPSRVLAFLLGLFLKSHLRRKDIIDVKKARKVLVSSNYTKKRVVETYNISAELFYPSVSNFFRPENKKECQKILKKFGINSPFILSHGRIIPDKRPEVFLEVAEILKDYELRGEKLQFVISGDLSESMKNKLEGLIEAKKLNNVKLLGKVSRDELLALYNCAKVFCVTAPKEDFGLTPIEAMACGTPVVAWNDGAGPNETVKENISGIFSKPYDVKDYSKKVIEALNKKWDEKKIIYSVKRFSEDEVKKELFRIVKEVFSQ